MIKNITVHPKGATHFQTLATDTYFLKQSGEEWLFKGKFSEGWIHDPQLNGDDSTSNFAKALLTKIGEAIVPHICTVCLPPVGDSFNNQVIF